MKDLKVELEKIWNGIDGFFLQNYWSSMPKRCHLVLLRAFINTDPYSRIPK